MNRKRRTISTIILCLLLSSLFTGCTPRKSTPVITIEGVDFKLGTAKPQDFLDSGFKELSHISYPASLDKKTISYEGPNFEKEGYPHIRTSIMNKSSQELPWQDCTIHIIRFDMTWEDLTEEPKAVFNEVYNDYFPSYEKHPYKEILLDGINFYGFTKEQVTEAMKDYKPSELSSSLSYYFSNYVYTFHFHEEGMLKDIEIKTKEDVKFDDLP